VVKHTLIKLLSFWRELF